MAYSIALEGVGGRRNLPLSPRLRSQAPVPYKVSCTPVLIGNKKPMYIRIAPAAISQLTDACVLLLLLCRWVSYVIWPETYPESDIMWWQLEIQLIWFQVGEVLLGLLALFLFLSP